MTGLGSEIITIVILMVLTATFTVGIKVASRIHIDAIATMDITVYVGLLLVSCIETLPVPFPVLVGVPELLLRCV